MRKNDAPLIGPWDLPLAFALLSRLPVPRLPDTALDRQAAAAWAFPLVGLAVTGLAVLGGLALMASGLPVGIAAGVAVALQVLLTGAMHEDGLADLADGFWGGWTVERRLEIMRDSQIGTYGVVALVLTIGLRWQAVSHLLVLAPAVLLAPALLSRAVLPSVMALVPPARRNGLARGVGAPGAGACTLAGLIALIGAALSAGAGAASVVVVVVALTAWGIAVLARARIGGQTGDVLGAIQQLSELAGLLALIVLL